MHFQQQKTTDRLKRRKSGILQTMLRSSSDEKPSVWVEGSTLRRFFSCKDPMEDLLSNKKKSILRHRQLLCRHGEGIHPRIARSGKLLSANQFQAYLNLLKAEREENINDQDGTSDDIEAPVCDMIISQKSCLQCDKCAIEYQEELKEKFAGYCRLLLLETTLGIESNINLSEQKGTYAVSRSFATNLRKFAWSKTLKQSLAINSCSKSTDIDVPVEGIDHFDLTGLVPGILNQDTEVQSCSKETLDLLVNSKIACE